MNELLRATPILDYTDEALSRLVADHGWLKLNEHDRVGAVYDFVRELPFGYNTADDIPASRVLADGFGQCNTKTTLLMALLRAVGIPARFHGATIHKRLQKGVVSGIAYRLAPARILHSWAEVRVDDSWVGLEGVICDSGYLNGVRTIARTDGAFLGYGVGTETLGAPPVEWRGSNTAIQQTGVNADFGTFPDPDSFYMKYGANLSGLRGVIYRWVVRPAMNSRVRAIRSRGRISQVE